VRKSVIAVAVLVSLCRVGLSAQRTPKQFEPSLDAAAKRTKLTLPAPTVAPDLKTTLHKMADVLGMLRGPEEDDGVITMHYWATGTMAVGGQTCQLANYRAYVRFQAPGMRVDYTCAAGAGQSGARHVEVVSGTYAWNESGLGVGPTAAMGTLNDRLLRLWTLPQGFVKLARAGGAKTTVTLEGGVVYVTAPLPAPLVGTARAALNTTDAFELTMDSGDKYQIGYTIDRIETRMGTVVTDTTFSDYGDWNEPDYKSDVWFPRRIVERRGGVTTMDLTVQKTNTYNPYVVMPVPSNVRQAQAR
jgi:hypothetical protein